ncbi:MAG: hypothetical protein LBT53_09665 [Puniceicoccales bacterium]|jgi:hypothetical protein|nr:hypothetical protein [Puniceicoccales bacterium]
MRFPTAILSAAVAVALAGLGVAAASDDSNGGRRKKRVVDVTVTVTERNGEKTSTNYTREEAVIGESDRKDWARQVAKRVAEEEALNRELVKKSLAIREAKKKAPAKNTSAAAAPNAAAATATGTSGTTSTQPILAGNISADSATRAPVAEKNPTARDLPAPTAANTGTELPDGTRLPWRVPTKLGDKTKNTDDSVDPYSALRNWSRLDKKYSSKRFASASWQNGGDSDTANLATRRATFGTDRWTAADGQTWGGAHEADGFSRAPNEVKLRETALRENNVRDHRTSAFNGETAALPGNTARFSAPRNTTFLGGADFSTVNRRFRVNKELSMQDINRYQFRRAHASTPGLPTVAPGQGVSPGGTR